MDKIASLIGVRERTRREVCNRLLKQGFTEEEADEAVESAVASGLLSEERYTRAFIRGKVSLGWGRNKIVERLEQEGIDDTLVEACSDEFPSGEEEYRMALHELSRRSTSSSDPYASYMRRLVGKGYSYDVAERAVCAYLGRGGESGW